MSHSGLAIIQKLPNFTVGDKSFHWMNYEFINEASLQSTWQWCFQHFKEEKGNLNILYEQNNKTQRGEFLIVVWGEVCFIAQLVKLVIEFRLTTRDGTIGNFMGVYANEKMIKFEINKPQNNRRVMRNLTTVSKKNKCLCLLKVYDNSIFLCIY